MPQNILLVQDDRTAARAVREALTGPGDGKFHVEWVRSCAEGVARVTQEATQARSGLAAVLIDLVLPDGCGIESVTEMLAVAPQVPILVLADAAHEHLARAAVQEGAQDYLLMSRLDPYSLSKILGCMVERAAIAEALFEEKERAQVTLDSIGDAVLCTDVHGAVTYLNVVAERMTGWPRTEAAGRPLADVLRVIDATTREALPNPMTLTIRDHQARALAQNGILLRRDGTEAPIEKSAAPIHDRRGRISGAVVVFRDVSIARAMSERMEHLARHDGLTDLPNRVLLDDRLGQAMVLARRLRKKMAVLFLDLDGFKDINDTRGHAVGDRVLRSVAQRLGECVRASDTVSRQGGDEFVILLSEVTRRADAAVTADKILHALRAPHGIDGHELQSSASIGIVLYPDDGGDAETLMKHADAAMYQAKRRGRDNFQFFDDALCASERTRAPARSTLDA
jgi:diguanylate cyclase (GGDEF)-like protein/PAS domain S-box-containing protein